MIQYTESYGSCPSEIQNIVANDVALFECYSLIQTGQNEWTAQIYTFGTGATRQLKFNRSTQQGYTNTYTLTRSKDIEFKTVYENEYYCFSNMGFGKSLELPVYEALQTYSLMIVSCMLLFAVVFKGALFKCLKKRR